MTEILRFEESAANPPALIATDRYGDSETLDVDPAVWARIESYICHRWSARQAVWTVRGPGEWTPHIAPLSATTVDVWDETTHTWSAAISEPSALGGLYLPSAKIYRITGTLGDTSEPVPALLVSAYQRLYDYISEAEQLGIPVGARSHSLQLGDGITESVEVNPAHVAKALQNSGAADLLRGMRQL